MIYRVLVLLFAIVLVAAGTERICAEVCSDSAADILDEDVAIPRSELEPRPVVPTTVHTAAPPTNIAPAPTLGRVFRPPRVLRG